MSEETEDTRPVRKLTDRHLIRLNEGDGHTDYLFDLSKVMLSETIAMEKAYNLTWIQIVAGLNLRRTPAIAAAVWVLRKRSNPKLKPDEVDWSMGDMEMLDPDFLPEYGGLEEGYAFGDEAPAEAPEDQPAEGEGPKDSVGPTTDRED